MKTIGFIGVGIMGKPMVRNLMKAGYQLHIYARTKAKVEDVIAEGAIFHDSIEECVKGRDTVITIVGYPKDVEDIYFGGGGQPNPGQMEGGQATCGSQPGILDSADPGTYLIDMTTTSPSLEERIFKKAKARGLHFLDAPVTGGDRGAKAGTLAILAGGEKADFDACQDIFQAMGKSIKYYGRAGSGQHAKLANQIMQASIMSAVCEAITYAKTQGLNMDDFLEGAMAGAGRNYLLEFYGPRMLADDMEPGFFVDFLIKDMGLGYESALDKGLELPSLKLTMDHYRKLSEEGLGREGMQALIKYYFKGEGDKDNIK